MLFSSIAPTRVCYITWCECSRAASPHAGRSLKCRSFGCLWFRKFFPTSNTRIVVVKLTHPWHHPEPLTPRWPRGGYEFHHLGVPLSPSPSSARMGQVIAHPRRRSCGAPSPDPRAAPELGRVWAPRTTSFHTLSWPSASATSSIFCATSCRRWPPSCSIK